MLCVFLSQRHVCVCVISLSLSLSCRGVRVRVSFFFSFASLALLRESASLAKAVKRTFSKTVANFWAFPLPNRLSLFAPAECTYQVKHGTAETDEYGGHVEIIHRESAKVVELRCHVVQFGAAQTLSVAFH